MFKSKSKKIALPLFFCVLSGLLFPGITYAELGSSGGLAADQAAEQRAAKAKKLEKKKLDAETKKAAESQQGEAPATQPTEAQQEKPPVQ